MIMAAEGALDAVEIRALNSQACGHKPGASDVRDLLRLTIATSLFSRRSSRDRAR